VTWNRSKKRAPSAFQQSMNDARDAAHQVTRCGLCPWTFVGTAGEGRAASAIHRRHEHPELPATVNILGKNKVVRKTWRQLDRAT
jgi:hypothetical protein